MVGGQTYPMVALRVMKNLVPLSGYDNDRIGMRGTVEIDGSAIEFGELGKEVVIQESTGNQYDVMIDSDKGLAFTDDTDSMVLTAILIQAGVEVSDVSTFTFRWFKDTVAGDVALGTGKTLTLGKDSVDYKSIIRVDVLQGEIKIASGYVEVTDYSDPLVAVLKTEGISGNVIRKGQTATLTPTAVKRSSGETVTTGDWNWRTRDNKGNDFVLTGKDSASFAAKSIQVTYADIQRASMALQAIFSINL